MPKPIWQGPIQIIWFMTVRNYIFDRCWIHFHSLIPSCNIALPALTPPPIQEEDGSAYDVDALLKGIDEQFDRANALINSLASINQDFNKITTVIDGLQRRVDEIIEKVKTIDIQAKLSEESKIELDNYHKNYKERLEQQLSDHAIQIDELINNYQIKHEVLLETYLISINYYCETRPRFLK